MTGGQGSSRERHVSGNLKETEGGAGGRRGRAGMTASTKAWGEQVWCHWERPAQYGEARDTRDQPPPVQRERGSNHLRKVLSRKVTKFDRDFWKAPWVVAEEWTAGEQEQSRETNQKAT